MGDPDEVIDEIAEAAATSISPGSMVRELSGMGDDSKETLAADDDSDLDEGTWLTDRAKSLEVGRWAKPCCLMWNEMVVRRDELKAAHESRTVLHGFKEGLIGFPPPTEG